MKKIKFIKNPIGAFGLAHIIGEESEYEIAICDELIEKGFAVEIETIEKAVKEPKTEKAVKK